jgi:hypothetical protein
VATHLQVPPGDATPSSSFGAAPAAAAAGGAAPFTPTAAAEAAAAAHASPGTTAAAAAAAAAQGPYSGDAGGTDDEDYYEQQQTNKHSKHRRSQSGDSGGGGTQTRTNALDTTTLDPRRAKRILANRQSAQRSRMKRLQYIHDLEGRSAAASATAKELQGEVDRLAAQQAALTEAVDARKAQVRQCVARFACVYFYTCILHVLRITTTVDVRTAQVGQYVLVWLGMLVMLCACMQRSVNVQVN